MWKFDSEVSYEQWMQSRVVIGLPTGHNTLRKHLHLMRLTNISLRRKSAAEEQTSANTLCECQTLASLRRTYLGSFFLDPEDIKSQSLVFF